MDPVARRCTVGTDQLRLTGKEFGVLECLARRPAQAVRKTEILDAVRDRAFCGDLNLVDVYVAALRRKLAGAGAGCPVETVRGHGHRLTPRRGSDPARGSGSSAAADRVTR